MDTLHSDEQSNEPTELSIEETPLEVMQESQIGIEPDDATEDNGIEVTVEECQAAYGLIIESAHSVIGTRNGAKHRDLPLERRETQGKLLHSICLKYGIKIPTEFDVVILGFAAVADWQYMTVKEGEEDVLHTNEETNEST